jgi:hypothetical protein
MRHGLGLTLDGVLTVTFVQAGTITLTFDDLVVPPTPGFLPIPDGYQGLLWSNFNVLPGKTLCAESGFPLGTVSEPNSMYNLDGNRAFIGSTRPFTVHNFSVTAAYKDSLTLEISASAIGGFKGSQTLTVSRSPLVTVDLGGNQVF